MSSVVDASSARERNRPWLEWVIPAVLCALMFGQLVFSSRQLSQTADEATHLYSGYRYLKCGDLTFSPEHPPLAKMVAAAPLLATNPSVDCAPFYGNDADGRETFTGLSWFYSTDWRPELFRARMAVSVFAIGLCLLVWIVARRMFGFGTAVVATLLVVFEPNVLASGTLVMTDMAVTVMFLFAVFGFYVWLRRPCASLLGLAGLAVGLTLLSKNSAVVIIPLLVVLAVVDAIFIREDGDQSRGRLMLRDLLAVGVISVIAFGVLWAGYGMRFAAHPGPAQVSEPASALPSTTAPGRLLLAIEQRRLLPQAYLEGFASDPHSVLNLLSGRPTPVFIFGKSYPQMQWFFMPLNFLVHSTVAFLAIAVLSFAGIVLSFKKSRREILFLLIPAAIFMACCMQVSWNGGMRHLLPVLPFLSIAIAAGCMELARRLPWVMYAVLCLLVLHAASSLHASPNYISYANEFWGGPTQTYKFFPYVDVGQSAFQVRDYIERHPSQDCWLLTHWWWDPQENDSHCRTFRLWQPALIPSRMQGTIIVSSTLLTDMYREHSMAMEAFYHVAPVDFIGGSAMLVFKGDFDTRGLASLSADCQAKEAIRQQQFNEALRLSDYAIQMSPENYFAHYHRAVALANLGQADAALTEFEDGRAMAVKDPFAKEQVLDFDAALRLLRG